LTIKKNNTSTNINASIGIKIEAKDIKAAIAVSTVVIIGFAIPAVDAVEVSRAAEAFPFMAAAVPPPAIMARAQVTTGFKSVTVATITAVPANVASGSAMVSSKLSSHGM